MTLKVSHIVQYVRCVHAVQSIKKTINTRRRPAIVMTRWYPVITPVAVTITMERTILITVYGSYVVLFQHQARSTHVQHRACLSSAAFQPRAGKTTVVFLIANPRTAETPVSGYVQLAYVRGAYSGNDVSY